MRPDQLPDISRKTKTLADGFAMGHNRYFFTITLLTGETEQTFAMVPEDAKAFVVMLAKGIQGFENFYGEIKAQDTPVPSPLDMSKPHGDNLSNTQ